MRFVALLWALLFAGAATASPPDTVLLDGYEHCAAPQWLCPDGDNDTYGNTPYCINACERPYDFFVLPGGDCNDDDGAVHPGAVELCDYVDNDCNGSTDELFPTLGAICNTGLPGVCQAGMVTCQAGGGGVQCQQSVPASTEVCDGLDNDCNGAADNGNPGGGAACMTGLPGRCATGLTNCTGGALQCVGTFGPIAELCNGIDDDCDGSVDDGDPDGGVTCNTGLPGVCAAGTRHCQGGGLQCIGNVGASVETCDGLDNDCDGAVDEGNPNGGLSCNTGQMGVCAAGTTQCSSGMLICQRNVNPAGEICDGLDNDCDGSVDEGCIP